MLSEFNPVKKLKVSPYSEYYAIEEMSDKFTKTPLLIVVDPISPPQLITKTTAAKTKHLSAVIVPDLSLIDQEFCMKVLDVIDDSPIELYEIPLVAKNRGTVYSNSRTVQIFNN